MGLAQGLRGRLGRGTHHKVSVGRRPQFLASGALHRLLEHPHNMAAGSPERESKVRSMPSRMRPEDAHPGPRVTGTLWRLAPPPLASVVRAQAPHSRRRWLN